MFPFQTVGCFAVCTVVDTVQMHEYAWGSLTSASSIQQTQVRPELTIPVSVIASNAARAEDDLAYLQKTTPFVAIRSVLQYCRS